MSGTTEQVGNLLNWVVRSIPGLVKDAEEAQQVVIREVHDMLPQRGAVFIRLAGISGLMAVGLGAYGAHVFRESKADPELKYTFETANRYHYFHTLALLGVPLTTRPYLVGTLMTAGMLTFSGSCYYNALTGNKNVRKITPYGGMMLMAAWFAMIL